MRVEENLWLHGAFYIDRDTSDQLRVVGPNNHLYFGSVGLYAGQLQVINVQEAGREVQLELLINSPEDFLPDPAMGHIRRVRSFIQIFGRTEPTFEEVSQDHPGELAPTRINSESEDGQTHITYLRTFGAEYYGFKLELPPNVKVHRDDVRRGYRLEAKQQPIAVTMTTITSSMPEPYANPILKLPQYDIDKLSSTKRTYARDLLTRTATEIEHLVRYGKTSGFDYGTVFPRDWMETADLIADDLTPAALRHMYTESLQHVNMDGVGWHEDIVGEYKYEQEQDISHLSRSFDDFVSPEHPLSPQFRQLLSELDELVVARPMIDIEPKYLLGLRSVPFADIDPENQKRLCRVADYVIHRAKHYDLITFNKLALPHRRQRGNEYYYAGNWRDSTLAFKQVHPVIAPYDVNVVLYPQALRVIRDHCAELHADEAQINQLIHKWDRVKDWYRFTNPDGIPAFALALYDVRNDDQGVHFEMLKVNHIDEAYEQAYGEPSEAEAKSFAQRLLSPDYFWTNSGPILVGHNEGYDHTHYHGEVVWTKQTAYVIVGLERQIDRGDREGWNPTTLALMRKALLEIAEISFDVFHSLGAIPELHYDDHGQPRLYTDQPAPEGQMNKVQLWSAAGARHILQSYLRHIGTTAKNPVPSTKRSA